MFSSKEINNCIYL